MPMTTGFRRPDSQATTLPGAGMSRAYGIAMECVRAWCQRLARRGHDVLNLCLRVPRIPRRTTERALKTTPRRRYADRHRRGRHAPRLDPVTLCAGRAGAPI